MQSLVENELSGRFEISIVSTMSDEDEIENLETKSKEKKKKKVVLSYGNHKIGSFSIGNSSSKALKVAKPGTNKLHS